jgi:hypothetical protein
VGGEQVALHAIGSVRWPSSPATTRCPCWASRCAIHCGKAERSTGSTWMVAPKFSRAPNQAPLRVILSRRGSSTSVRVDSLPCAACANCCRAVLPSLPGLPDGMRTSTIWRSAKRLSEPPAASTSLQSKWAPATVCTVRSV